MLRLGVRVQREHAELVLAELLALSPSGVEEVELDGGLVEYAVYGAPGELPAVPALQAAAGGALVEISSREIADDWKDRWRRFHRPLVLDDLLRIRPPWEPPAREPIDVVIDPGQAFGTGAHPTTRLCLELMLELHEERGAFVDLGCGSGVLAIAAAQLGFAPVIALDSDPAAIEATVANAGRNGIAAAVHEEPGWRADGSPPRLDVRRHDLRHERLPPADTVAANLLAPLLLTLARQLHEGPPADRPSRIIASGLLRAEAAACAAAFALTGFAESGRRSHGEWSALLLDRGSAT
jgi:ribosomal protein L11 methyltransferase